VSRTDTAVRVIRASPGRAFAALTDPDALAGFAKGASERTVPMVPALHEILLAASAERETRGGAAATTHASARTTFGRGFSPPCENAPTNCSPLANNS
jgi:hypothetical protein